MGAVNETPGEILARFLAGRRTVALTGAGISTESGIPDYRGPSGASSRRHVPMTYQTFISDPVARRRYWARGFLGWSTMGEAKPNAGHRALAELEVAGAIAGTITQNVDGLHQKAGSSHVVDLHGRLDRVVCLDCADLVPRVDVHRRLALLNEGWQATITAMNPDGDAQIDDDQLDGFSVAACERCGGTLKPDVVYFGESVPRPRVEQASQMLAGADALVVLGSSLTVYSGRRFMLQAAKAGKPIAIVNQGPVRDEEVAELKLDAPLGDTLDGVVRLLAVS